MTNDETRLVWSLGHSTLVIDSSFGIRISSFMIRPASDRRTTMTRIAPTGSRPPSGDADPFRLGWRDVRHVQPDGTETWEQVPLTMEDLLHPSGEMSRCRTPRTTL